MRPLSDPMFWLALVIALLQGQAFVDRWRHRRIKTDVGMKAADQSINRDLRQLTLEVRQLSDNLRDARTKWHEVNNGLTRLVGEVAVRNDQYRRDIDRIDKAIDDMWLRIDHRRAQGA